MIQENTKLPSITLLGIMVRTNNKFETSPLTSKIGPCAQRYGQEHIFNKISNRKNPGRTFCVYTDYESDHTGDYTFFIGEEINESPDGNAKEKDETLDSIASSIGLKKHVIPPQNYAKFTTEQGIMPLVAINAWQNIWQMTPETLGGKRRFHTDFQIHDERALNPMSTILDIYVGIE